MKTDREVLEGALELVSRYEGWSKGAYCQYKDGRQVSIQVVQETPVDTLSFCLEGAIRYAAGWFDHLEEESSYRAIPNRIIATVRQVNRLEMLVIQTGFREGLTGPFLRLCTFNDNDRTSQSDAVLALKKTLEEVE